MNYIQNKPDAIMLEDLNINVLLRVHHDYKLTQACINSAIQDVLRIDNAKLIIINDGSPEDEMKILLNNAIKKWGEKILFINNKKELGFVESINGALEYSNGCDVVLLSNYILTPNRWLRRLQIEAYSENNIGTVTPLSNNAGICSFPEFCQNNKTFINRNRADIDAAFENYRTANVDSPIGMYFCMYIKNECIKQVGAFCIGDTEKNDFCQKAAKIGWRNIITPNLYLYNESKENFSDKKNALLQANQTHNDCNEKLTQFMQHEPLKKYRISRLIKFLNLSNIPKILHIAHGLGGGVQVHVEELCQWLNDNTESYSIILFTSNKGEKTLRMGASNTADEIFLHKDYPEEKFIYLLKAIGISIVHYHHILGASSALLKLPQTLNIPYRFTAHDYYLICANPNLSNKFGCFTEDMDQLLENVAYKPHLTQNSVKQWQQYFGLFLKKAEVVIYPSEAVREIFDKYYHDDKFIIAPHLEENRFINNSEIKFKKKDSYNIGVIGALTQEKGLFRLAELAQINSNSYQIQFTLIGYPFSPIKNVKIIGKYDNGNVQNIINSENIDIILFTANCPETYSYTLSIALEAGLPIVAPNIGDFPERLSGREKTLLYAFNLNSPTLFQSLLQFIKELEDGELLKADIFTRTMAYKENFYKENYLTGIKPKVGCKY